MKQIDSESPEKSQAGCGVKQQIFGRQCLGRWACGGADASARTARPVYLV